MRTILLLGLATMAVLLPLERVDAQPQQWELQQNDPNPFCGVTVIRFAAPQAAIVHLVVWNPEGSEVVRNLLEGLLNPGYYEILWDQTDENGVTLADDDYPYRLTAADPDTGELIFEASLIATVDCDPTPTDIETWGRIKGRFAHRR